MSGDRRMESSYREKLSGVEFSDDEMSVVLDATMTLCPPCRNDDPTFCRVTLIDEAGFITEVRLDLQAAEFGRGTDFCTAAAIKPPKIFTALRKTTRKERRFEPRRH